MSSRSEECKSRLCVTPNRADGHELIMNQFLELNSSQLMDIFFGDTVNNFRKSVETMTAQQQCKRIIGECCELEVDNNYKFFEAGLNNKEVNSYCWICGYGLKQLAPEPTIHYELRSRHIPETIFEPVHCEHIVPVLFACLFGGLHSRVKKENVFTDVFTKATASNYKYAHGSCNMKKSNLLLFKWDDAENRMVFNETNGLALFEKIKIMPDDELYKEAFLQNLRTHINPICDLINAEYAEFKSENKDMTSYIKYTINCTGYYFSAKDRENFLSPEEQRRKMSFYFGNMKKIVEQNRENPNEVQISTGILYDILRNSELYVSTANAEKYVRTPAVSSATKRVLTNAPMSDNKKKATDEVINYRPLSEIVFETPKKKGGLPSHSTRSRKRRKNVTRRHRIRRRTRVGK